MFSSPRVVVNSHLHLVQLLRRSLNHTARRMQARFAPLFSSCYSETLRAAARDALPRHTHEPLIRLLSAHLPYYVPPEQVMHHLHSLPPLSGAVAGSEVMPDFVVAEIAMLLLSAASVEGLLRYLNGLEPVLMVSSQWKRSVSLVQLLRLQGALYRLTLPGGPRCGAGAASSPNVRSMSRPQTANTQEYAFAT
jgi:hypothetical protein